MSGKGRTVLYLGICVSIFWVMQVLMDLYQGHTDPSDEAEWGYLSPGSSAADMISQQVQQVLRCKALTVNELLRHFWASYPVNSAVREVKVNKLMAALMALYDRCELHFYGGLRLSCSLLC